jgi:hypothetical protein
MASKVLKPEGRALTFRAKAAWSVARTDAAKHFGGVGNFAHAQSYGLFDTDTAPVKKHHKLAIWPTYGVFDNHLPAT